MQLKLQQQSQFHNQSTSTTANKKVSTRSFANKQFWDLKLFKKAQILRRQFFLKGGIYTLEWVRTQRSLSASCHFVCFRYVIIIMGYRYEVRITFLHKFEFPNPVAFFSQLFLRVYDFVQSLLFSNKNCSCRRGVHW